MAERPMFLFDKNQSYTKSNSYKNKETLPDSFTCEFEKEIKNEVIYSKVEHLSINTMDNIIDIKDYSDVIKLFRVTALVIRFVKNLFRKIEGDYLHLNSYVDAKKICKAKVQWVKGNQFSLLKSENYEHFSKNLSLKFDHSSILFTCNTSRAVTLDLVEDNTSKNVINSIKKFIATTGYPKNIV